MITDEDKKKLGELVMKVFDSIEEEFGEDAEFSTAAIVYEVKKPDPDEPGEYLWSGRYRAIPGTSPHYSGGLFQVSANMLLAGPTDFSVPDDDDSD